MFSLDIIYKKYGIIDLRAQFQMKKTNLKNYLICKDSYGIKARLMIRGNATFSMLP